MLRIGGRLTLVAFMAAVALDDECVRSPEAAPQAGLPVRHMID